MKKIFIGLTAFCLFAAWYFLAQGKPVTVDIPEGKTAFSNLAISLSSRVSGKPNNFAKDGLSWKLNEKLKKVKASNAPAAIKQATAKSNLTLTFANSSFNFIIIFRLLS